MDVVTDHDISDGEIIDAARRAPDHFAAVFDRHYSRIYAYAARRLGRDLAEDALDVPAGTVRSRRPSRWASWWASWWSKAR